MYLMNVPPVAVTQTEWRTCGPPGGYSLQCFDDSDTELSTRGTPISDKVQMIIESLRSTQSSLEMGDEIEGNVLPGQDGHPQDCKVAMGSYVGAKSKAKSPTETQHADVSSPVNQESSDSDSDGSVDRGIEEAIAEYLKEKGDHKRKAEPCSSCLPSSKIQRKNPPVPDISKLNSDNSEFLITSIPYPKSIKVETPAATAAVPLKKYIKNKASLHENMVCKSTITECSIFPKEQTNYPVTVKVEDDSLDSSSDDGIEEAIQRYQLEKREQQNRREAFSPHAVKGESDSTSDDGIEEAIRCYQLEQLKAFTHKKELCSNSSIHAVGSTSMENMKKPKVKKKKTKPEKEVKSLPSSSAIVPSNSLSESKKGTGNGLLTFKVENFKDQPKPPPPKFNTTAELMCAEAILDISKTVMPEVFHPNVDGGSCGPTESSLQSSFPNTSPDDVSDDSSIDSEDGIEQEIRKFLEQKAQLHQQPPCSAVTQEPRSVNEPAKVKAKVVVTQKKPQRLPLVQRRKHKEENHAVSKISDNQNNDDETAPKCLPDQRKDMSLPILSSRSQRGLHETEQSGDKSSSLDSDEDLDTAIKDLLKTKKKSKKKTRDLKRKPRKCLKDEELLLRNASQTQKLKPDPLSQRSTQKNVQKIKDATKNKTVLSKKILSQQKLSGDSEEQEMQGGEKAIVNVSEGQVSVLLHSAQIASQLKEDSSSVDSDDSIEQEIRRFLAEKAKVSTAVKSDNGNVARNGTTADCSTPRVEVNKEKNQLADISTKSIATPYSRQSLSSLNQDRSRSLVVPQSLLSDTASVAQSCMSSVQFCSPGLSEPADGAGAARPEQSRPSTGRGGIQESASQMERDRPGLSPSVARSHFEAIKWRQSLGLPITHTKTLSRQTFHVTSSKINDTAPATLPYLNRGIHVSSQTQVAAWSATRTSGASFSWATEKTINTTLKSPVLNMLSSPRQHPRMSFTQSLSPGNRSPCPIEGERQSMVHISKDKSVFVELETNRTNHVQVRSRERSEGREREDLQIEKKKDNESLTTDDKEEKEFVDETDSESDNRRNPEKKQGFSKLSLSRAIDPGITIRPCIALTTEERSQMFSRRYLPQKFKKCLQEKASLIHVPVQKKTLLHVRRKLQFVPVNRRNVADSQHRTTE